MYRQRKRRKLFLKISFFVVILLSLIISTILFEDVDKISIPGDKVKIRILNHQTNRVMEIGLEEYLVGVISAEMPASFPLEALKAQAVAARTYAVKHLQVPDSRIKILNAEADLSTDPAIHQAWISSIDMKNKWGLEYSTYKNKIIQAVQETIGQVIVYQGQLIDPVYHSSCGGGKTENSEDVWKYKVPYLRSVTCIEYTDRYREVVNSFSFQEIDKLLGINLQALPTRKLQVNSGFIKIIEKSTAGRVKKISLDNKTFTGIELRSKLGLPSTWFNWQIKDNSILFITRGYGHAVGMSQYGAATMADLGKNYQEIIQFYYTGVELTKLKT